MYSHPIRTAAGPIPGRPKSGFTLTELLIVISIIAVLVALLIPAVRNARRMGLQAREMSAARQLTIAYSTYTYDNQGVLMPGYWAGPGGQSLPAHDHEGNLLSGEPAHRWPWRLAPYLDYNLEGLYLDKNLIEALSHESLYVYLVSLYPSLGMNSLFIGGDTSAGQPYVPTHGEFWVKRFSQVRHPAELIVFASARTDVPWGAGAPPLIEGYFRVIPPYLTQRNWADVYDEHASPSLFGNLSLRHPNRAAVVGMLDGSANVFTEAEIQDMRHWADRATTPNWTLGSP